MSEESTALAAVDPQTGEVIESTTETSLALVDRTYDGMSAEPVSPEAAAVLSRSVDPAIELDIKPTGETFMGHIHIRRRLSEAFGQMGWALRPLSPIRIDANGKGSTLYQEWALYASGRFVAYTVADGRYHDDNDNMSYADAAESLKSNALLRCAKDLNIGWECWDRRFTEKFQDEYCVKVWREGKKKPFWRRKDTRPWWDEKSQGSGSSQSQPQQRQQTQRPQQQSNGAPKSGATQPTRTSSQPAAQKLQAPVGPQTITKVMQLKEEGGKTTYGIETAELGAGQWICTDDINTARAAYRAGKDATKREIETEERDGYLWLVEMRAPEATEGGAA